MCQKHYNTKEKKWEHIIWEERIIIEHLYNVQKKNFTEIGKAIGKDRTTISREIKRGLVEILNSDYTTKLVYSADIAQSKHDINGSAKGPMLKIANDHELARFIEMKIKEKYSPEVIANIIKKEDKGFKTKIHWKTIYNYIQKGILMVGKRDLTYGEYNKAKRGIKHENPIRKIKKEGRRIQDRPEEAKVRKELGHWEMDLVEGKKGAKEPVLLVLSERCSRKEIIILIKNKTQSEVIKALDRIERKLGVLKFRETFKTITTDNGSEFLDYKGIERSYTRSKKPRTRQYYADAYSSWQRGTNENINKMIRRFLPKEKSFKDLTETEVSRIEEWINNYPRKMFGFKSANEIYKEKISA